MLIKACDGASVMFVKKISPKLLWCAVIAFAFVFACAKKPEKEAFEELWSAKAEKSEGFSPASTNSPIVASRAIVTTPKEMAHARNVSDELPTDKITLKMYDANIVTVLRAMARIANQNIIFSSGIPGVAMQQSGPAIIVNIDVRDAPWDQTFKSLLNSNKLAFEKKEGIIKIVRVEDIEAQQKIAEARNKLFKEEDVLKKSSQMVVSKIPLNYIDLKSAYNTIAMLCGYSGKDEEPVKENSFTSKDKKIEDPTALKIIDSLKIDPLGRFPGQLSCSVVPDKHSNMLIAEGPASDIEKIISIINDIDKAPYQVKLKAIIVETTSSTAQALGIQWGGILKNSNFRILPAQAGTINSTSNAASAGATTSASNTSAGSSSSLSTESSATNSASGNVTANNTYTPIYGGGSSGQGFAINNPVQSLTNAATGLGAAGTGINFLFGKIGENVLEAQITALAEQGRAKVLSSPTITTMENHKAYIVNGQEIPYVSASQQGTNVQTKDAVLRLEMIPHVVGFSDLRMNILVQDDQVDENKDNWVQGNPPIFKRETRSDLVVGDGDTIVVSGLMRDTSSTSEGGVPFLKDVPGLGWAFKYKEKANKKNEILIFITPTILKQKPVPNAPF